MKNLITAFLTICVLQIPISCIDESKSKSQMQDPVRDLLTTMSVEEKVGQMTQVTLGMIMSSTNPEQIDIDKLRVAIVDKKVGSILNVNGQALSLEQWHELITTIQDMALKETRQRIPILYGIDAIHGASYIKESTLFPHNIGMAASRNPDLVKEAAKITAMETRASGVRWNFDPTLGIGREPLWSRFEETFGEDVCLLKTMSKSAIEGYEEDGLRNTTSVASCMKHFLGYSYPKSGKDRTPAYIPDNMLREYFLPPFEAAVKAGTSTVMINSGEINGIPVHGSSYYLQDILRDELQFEGLAVSDWEDIIRLHTRHHIAATPREAVKIGVNAGIDMSMVPMDYSFYDHLVDLVNEGEVSIKRIDEAVYRILSLKFNLGLFDNAYPELEAKKNFGNPKYEETALQAARESIVLAKNSNSTLPLNKNSKVLLAGPAANNVSCLHSSWSYTWQGADNKAYPKRTKTIKDALVEKIGANNVICNSVSGFSDVINYDVNFIRSNASRVDYIILALGESAYAESPGVIDDLNLDQNQVDLARAAFKTGKPVILLMAQGRPRIISGIEPDISSILLIHRPGSQGARATADILFGDYNPSGKLPYTYQRSSGDIILYDHKYSEKISEAVVDTYSDEGFKPQWDFGHGLSYTTFDYSELATDKTSLTSDEVIVISVVVTNSGKIAGEESVELYSSDLYASVTPQNRMLKKFNKVRLQPGESKKVQFSINKEDLSLINAKGIRVTEPGEFKLQIDKLSQTITYQQ